MASKIRKESSQLDQFVCFKLIDEEYAFDINWVREVIKIPVIAPVPQMPSFSLGIINIRGSIVPVFDPRIKLGLNKKELTSKCKIIVIQDDLEKMVGFLVDEILENIKLSRSEIVPTPVMRLKVDPECFQGVGSVDDRTISILNIKKLLEILDADIKNFGTNNQAHLSH